MMQLIQSINIIFQSEKKKHTKKKDKQNNMQMTFPSVTFPI